MPLVPILGILICLLLMFSLPVENWLRLFVWLALGLVIYFVYGRHHSVWRSCAARSHARRPPAGKSTRATP